MVCQIFYIWAGKISFRISNGMVTLCPFSCYVLSVKTGTLWLVWLCDAIWRHGSWSSLVQVMFFRPLDTKPWPKTVLPYCLMAKLAIMSEIQCHFDKCICKWRLHAKCRPFCSDISSRHDKPLYFFTPESILRSIDILGGREPNVFIATACSFHHRLNI